MPLSAARISPVKVTSTGCCPRFDVGQAPAPELQLQDRLFLRERVRMLFHVPLNVKRKRSSAMALIGAAGASAKRPLMLCASTSPWRSELYVEATKDVPEADMTRLSGRFMSKVFEGPFRDTPKWLAELERLASACGERIERVFADYTTCPDCSRAYEENFVVLYAQLT